MVPMIACGIFQWELEHILPEVEKELGEKVELSLLTPALDVSEARLEAAVREGAARFGNQSCALLYGSMCHGNMKKLGETCYGSVYPAPPNCAAIFLGTEKKKELDSQGNFYYISSGELKMWRKVYQEEQGWDEADARMNFGYFEKIIVLDTGICEITDEMLFEFFDFVQIPVEVEKLSLSHFKGLVLDLCQRLLAQRRGG
ncbi:MAG: DUF1638 domain-containing protein [Spirochaetaceae bacterium]|jgi:hypothetical protein|nr:DUF1638 domain-containing protein [Spirochaetaceae bacterium]